MEEAFNRIEALSKDKGAMRGIATGFQELDQILSGLQKSDLTILGCSSIFRKIFFGFGYRPQRRCFFKKNP